jgi:hypothetical protein
MKRLNAACGLFGALLFACGCGSSKPEVPSWFKGSGGPRPDIPKQPAVKADSQQRELEVRVEKVKTQIKAFDKVVKDLEDEKKETVSKLRSLGIRSADDIKEDNRRAQNLYKRLKQVIGEIEATRQKADDYQIALDHGQAVLRDFKRKLELQKAGVSEEEIDKVVATIIKIDERLKASGKPEAVNENKVEKDAAEVLKNGDF